MQKPLPDFEEPPVAEVALSVQFDPLTEFRIQHVGQLWECYKTEFPRVTEQPPIAPAYELFTSEGLVLPALRMELTDYAPLPRIWFINETDTRLIQIQRDRFVYNWRRAYTHEPYPRYPDVKKSFEKQFVIFREFLMKQGFQDLVPNQCEVTYVNLIEADDRLASRGQANQLLTAFRLEYSDDTLSEPEDVRMALRYRIPGFGNEPAGRLHIALDPVYGHVDQAILYRLNIMARGKPLSENEEGVLAFFDLGREWIVRSFAAVTTKTMHRRWKRVNDNNLCND